MNWRMSLQQRHATAHGPLSLGRPEGLAEQEAELATGVRSGRQAAFPRGTQNAARVFGVRPAPDAAETLSAGMAGAAAGRCQAYIR